MMGRSRSSTPTASNPAPRSIPYTSPSSGSSSSRAARHARGTNPEPSIVSSSPTNPQTSPTHGVPPGASFAPVAAAKRGHPPASLADRTASPDPKRWRERSPSECSQTSIGSWTLGSVTSAGNSPPPASHENEAGGSGTRALHSPPLSEGRDSDWVPLDEDTVRRDTHAPSDVVPVPAAAASPPRHSSAGAEDTEHVTVDERLWSTIEALFDLVKRQEAIRVEQDEHRQQLRTIGAAIQRFERASARVEYNAARLETSMNASPFRRLHEAVDSMQLLADNSITQVIASAERFDNLNLGNVLTRLEKTADLFSRVSGPMNATSTGVSEHMPNMVVPDLVEKVDNLTAKVDSWATSVSDGVECQVKLLKDNVRVVIGRTGMMDERLTKLEDTMSSINSNLAALVSRLDAGGVTDGPLNTATVTPISSIASADATAPVNPSTAGPASREDASGDTEMRPAQPSAQMQVELIPEQWDEIQGIQIAALSAASGLEALEQKVNYLCTWTEDNTMHTPLAVIAADIGEIRSLMEVRTYGSSATSYSAPTVVRPAVTSPITAPTPRIDLPPASPVRSQEPTLLPPPPAAPPARPPPARPPPSKPVPPPPDVAIVTLASGKKKKRRAKSATPKPGDGDATPAPEPLPAPYQNLAPEPEPPGSGPSRFLASSSAPINNRWDRVSEMLKPVGFEMSNERGSAADNETARPQDKGKQKMTWEELQREQRGLSDKGWDWW